jgi:hypothetical protein
VNHSLLTYCRYNNFANESSQDIFFLNNCVDFHIVSEQPYASSIAGAFTTARKAYGCHIHCSGQFVADDACILNILCVYVNNIGSGNVAIVKRIRT